MLRSAQHDPCMGMSICASPHPPEACQRFFLSISNASFRTLVVILVSAFPVHKDVLILKHHAKNCSLTVLHNGDAQAPVQVYFSVNIVQNMETVRATAPK